MFLCCKKRRISAGRVLQRQVLYLGELNGRQEAAWRKTVDLFGEDPNQPSQVALFDENHPPIVVAEGDVPIVGHPPLEYAVGATKTVGRRPAWVRIMAAAWSGCVLAT